MRSSKGKPCTDGGQLKGFEQRDALACDKGTGRKQTTVEHTGIRVEQVLTKGLGNRKGRRSARLKHLARNLVEVDAPGSEPLKLGSHGGLA